MSQKIKSKIVNSLVSILNIKDNSNVLEPCVDESVFAQSLLLTKLAINDLEPETPDLLLSQWRVVDSFLNYPIPQNKFDWIIGCPPEQEFQEYILKARELSKSIAFLLPLDVLDSSIDDSRYKFWKENPYENLYVLNKRIVYVDDTIDYRTFGFFVWKEGIGNLNQEIISWK